MGQMTYPNFHNCHLTTPCQLNSRFIRLFATIDWQSSNNAIRISYVVLLGLPLAICRVTFIHLEVVEWHHYNHHKPLKHIMEITSPYLHVLGIFANTLLKAKHGLEYLHNGHNNVLDLYKRTLRFAHNPNFLYTFHKLPTNLSIKVLSMNQSPSYY